MKQCTKCKQIKDESEFYKNKDKLRPSCKTCHNSLTKQYDARHPDGMKQYRTEWMKNWYHNNKQVAKVRNKKNYHSMQERRRLLILEAKVGGCKSCGEDRPTCLVFHHLHDKDTEVSKLRTAVAVLRELSKCIVLCGNCHLLCHAGEIQLPDDIATIDTTKLTSFGKDCRYK
jgi:hypothetical protein